jgi:uncharacterized protein (DUF302 family)
MIFGMHHEKYHSNSTFDNTFKKVKHKFAKRGIEIIENIMSFNVILPKKMRITKKQIYVTWSPFNGRW